MYNHPAFLVIVDLRQSDFGSGKESEESNLTLTEIRNSLNNPEYSFLRTNPQLSTHLIILTLGGSHTYGTNNE